MTSDEYLARVNAELERLGFDELVGAHQPPLYPMARFLAKSMLAGWLNEILPELVAEGIIYGFIKTKNKLFKIQ